jgi:hypothetical protein
MDEAISRLSVHGNPIDSRRALYLVSAPAEEMNMDLAKSLGEYLRGLAPKDRARIIIKKCAQLLEHFQPVRSADLQQRRKNRWKLLHKLYWQWLVRHMCRCKHRRILRFFL